MRTLLVLVGLLLAAAPAAAAEEFALAADASGDPGRIALGVVAPLGVGRVTLSEDGETLGEVALVPLGDAAPGLGYGFLRRAAAWRCDRLVRHFNARGRALDGELFSTGVYSRTPSCRNRVALRVPRRVAPGGDIPIRVRDTFRAGDVHGRLCVTPPAGAARCRPLGLARGTTGALTSVRARRPGQWRVTVRTAQQRRVEDVAVGARPRPRLPTVLVTGDSQMQNLDAVLADRLTGRALVTSDVHNGSGLVTPDPVDWATLPAAQTARGAPAATVVALGANDAGELDGVACCDARWRAAYARRAAATMRAYVAGGGRVFWLTVPIAREAYRHPATVAVNAAVRAAAARVPRATVLDMAALFTPGDRYRGRRGDVDVRARDGLHLSVAGAAIAGRVVDRALGTAGLVARADGRR